MGKRVIDLVIPPKRDTFGKKIGFVRFLDMNNPKALEEKLDAIWIGTFKLRVNIPFFGRNETGGMRKGHYPMKETLNRRNGISEGLSYAKAAAGGDINKQQPGNKVRPKFLLNRGQTSGNCFRGLEFNATAEDLDWLKTCYVGKELLISERSFMWSPYLR